MGWSSFLLLVAVVYGPLLENTTASVLLDPHQSWSIRLDSNNLASNQIQGQYTLQVHFLGLLGPEDSFGFVNSDETCGVHQITALGFINRMKIPTRNSPVITVPFPLDVFPVQSSNAFRLCYCDFTQANCSASGHFPQQFGLLHIIAPLVPGQGHALTADGNENLQIFFRPGFNSLSEHDRVSIVDDSKDCSFGGEIATTATNGTSFRVEDLAPKVGQNMLEIPMLSLNLRWLLPLGLYKICYCNSAGKSTACRGNALEEFGALYGKLLIHDVTVNAGSRTYTVLQGATGASLNPLSSSGQFLSNGSLFWFRKWFEPCDKEVQIVSHSGPNHSSLGFLRSDQNHVNVDFENTVVQEGADCVSGNSFCSFRPDSDIYLRLCVLDPNASSTSVQDFFNVGVYLLTRPGTYNEPDFYYTFLRKFRSGQSMTTGSPSPLP